MSTIAITDFVGVSPRIRPRYLQNNQAQTALNSKSWVGSLMPLPNTSQIATLPKTGTLQSIYRFGESQTNELNYWFHWTGDVDVVKGFVYGDTSERTFFSGDGVPKVTDNTLATTSSDGVYPSNSYTLGVPKPTSAPTVNVSGTAATGYSEENRVYTYTYVNSWGEESEPYSADPIPGSMKANVKTGQSVTVTLPVFSGGNYNITSKRIYRSVVGDGVGTYLYVGEVTNATTSFIDNVDVADLGEEMPSLTWTHPKASLKGFVGMPNGIIAAFDGRDVYFSEPYRPFAWPVDYSMTTKYNIVGLGVIDTTLVVLTEGTPVFIQGDHPDSMVMVDADISQACASKRSIVSMNNMVYYASPDGLVALSPGGSQIITESLYDKYQWQSFKADSIHGYQFEGRYVGFYDNGTTQGGFIYDNKTASFVLHSMYATGGYNDLKNDTLYLIISNALHKWEAGADLTYQWKSKQFTYPKELSFSCIKVDAEAYTVTIKVYRDGVLVFNQAISDDRVKRLPSGHGKTWEIEATGTNEIYSIKLGGAPEELL